MLKTITGVLISFVKCIFWRSAALKTKSFNILLKIIYVYNFEYYNIAFTFNNVPNQNINAKYSEFSVENQHYSAPA